MARVRGLLTRTIMQARLGLHTAMYILSVTAVLAAALNPNGTATFLRHHSRRIAATVRSVSETATGAPAAASEMKRPPSTGQTRARELRPDQYRLAIGTVLPVQLRSAIDSATARVHEQFDAVLSAPVKQDDIELIPSGSVLHGTIVQAEPATRERPRGRVEIVFTVVQHADTRSRAAIRTRPLMFEAEAPAETARGRKAKKQPIDVVLPAGHHLMLTLADTLVVHIPHAR